MWSADFAGRELGFNGFQFRLADRQPGPRGIEFSLTLASFSGRFSLCQAQFELRLPNGQLPLRFCLRTNVIGEQLLCLLKFCQFCFGFFNRQRPHAIGSCRGIWFLLQQVDPVLGDVDLPREPTALQGEFSVLTKHRRTGKLCRL